MKQAIPKDVDAYIAAAPHLARPLLEQLRKTIRAAAPKTNEVISYGIPTYKYDKSGISFGWAKSHCALYGIGKAIVEANKDELQPYITSTTTIRFALDKPLPVALVKKLVKARITEMKMQMQMKAGMKVK